MYSSLLLVHSWIRWVVLLSALALTFLFVRGWLTRRTWGGSENAQLWIFSQTLLYQGLFGLLLYVGGSPFTKLLISAPSTALSNPVPLFWSVRHPLTMLSSIAVFFVGRYLTLKKAHPQNKFRSAALTLATTMLIILTAVPWSGLLYGRSWFRWTL